MSDTDDEESPLVLLDYVRLREAPALGGLTRQDVRRGKDVEMLFLDLDLRCVILKKKDGAEVAVPCEAVRAMQIAPVGG